MEYIIALLVAAGVLYWVFKPEKKVAEKHISEKVEFADWNKVMAKFPLPEEQQVKTETPKAETKPKVAKATTRTAKPAAKKAPAKKAPAKKAKKATTK
jgi:hypothetical protein